MLTYCHSNLLPHYWCLQASQQSVLLLLQLYHLRRDAAEARSHRVQLEGQLADLLAAHASQDADQASAQQQLAGLTKRRLTLEGKMTKLRTEKSKKDPAMVRRAKPEASHGLGFVLVFFGPVKFKDYF